MNLFRRCPCPEDATCEHPWWYKFKHKGLTYSKSTKHTNRRLAERVAIRKRNVVIGERAGLQMEEAPPQPLFSVARERYIDDWAKGDHPATAESKDDPVLRQFE